jgi:NADH-quinone oxidoreductase subunit J
MNALFFWFFSLAMIVCGLSVILSRNAVASAICFAFTIFYMAGLFVMLDAFFLAAVQILVTAGAVMVLFLFIIMLLDLSAAEKIPRQKIWMGASLLLGLGFIYLVARTLNDMPEGRVGIDSAPAPFVASDELKDARAQAHPGATPGFLNDLDDDTHRIGRLLFRTKVGPHETTYVAPFEITSLLILVATIGVIVLCKEDEPRRPDPREEIVREAPPLEPKKEPILTR